ncbi:CBS domain-containing protein [bacterium]|nr:CBS domain-containing protein [bacterium]
MQIKEIMSKDVVRAYPEHTLEEAAKMMRENDTGMLPVEENDKLIGVLTDRDIVVRAVAGGQNPAVAHVRTVMSDDDVLYCYEGQDVEDVAENMAKQQVRRLVVLNNDDDKRLVGVVSLGDIATGAKNEETVAEAAEGVSRG